MLEAINVIGIVCLSSGIGLGAIGLLGLCFEPSSDVPPIVGAVGLFLGLIGLAAFSVTA